MDEGVKLPDGLAALRHDDSAQHDGGRGICVGEAGNARQFVASLDVVDELSQIRRAVSRRYCSARSMILLAK